MILFVCERKTFPFKYLFICSILISFNPYISQGRTLSRKNDGEKYFQRTLEMASVYEASKRKEQVIKEPEKEWNFPPVSLSTGYNGESSSLSDMLTTVETFLQEEETRLLKDIREFHKTLRSHFRLQTSQEPRLKRDTTDLMRNVDLKALAKGQGEQKEWINREKSFNTIKGPGSEENVSGGKTANDDREILEGESQRPVGDFRRKFAMKLMKDNTGHTTIHFDYDYETLGKYIKLRCQFLSYAFST